MPMTPPRAALLSHEDRFGPDIEHDYYRARTIKIWARPG